MKAILQQPDQSLIWADTDSPTLADHQVRIKVAATAINRADLMQRKGLYPPPPGASPILGLECAGTIMETGAAVNQWQQGDRVCALLTGGGYAEQVVCDARHVLPIPAQLTFAQAAALPEVFATAWLNLFLEAKLKPGERVLLHAGASGVGTAAIQLCKAFDNPCYVTVGTAEKLTFCTQLGAQAGCLRGQDDFQQQVKSWTKGNGVDVILDPVGGDYLDANLRSLNNDGRLIIIGIMGGRGSNLDLGRLLVKRLRVIGSTLRSRSDNDKAELIASMREHVWPHIESGTLQPVIDDSYPIQQVESAMAAMESNKNQGKIVLTLSDSTTRI